MKKLFLLLLIIFHSYTRAQNANVTIINQLNEGENYTISIVADGCFNREFVKIEIAKNKTNYTLSVFGQTIILTDKNLATLHHFEINLRNIPLAGCTSTDTYQLTYNGKSTYYVDNTCSLQYGKRLFKELEIPNS